MATYVNQAMKDAQGRTYAHSTGLAKIDSENKQGTKRCLSWAFNATHAAGSKDYAAQALVKVDLCKADAPLVAWHKPNFYPCEPMFVPAPDQKSEDDGVLLTPVLDGEARTSYIQVLDAKSMTEIVTANMPFHTPFAIHGNWFGTKK